MDISKDVNWEGILNLKSTDPLSKSDRSTIDYMGNLQKQQLIMQIVEETEDSELKVEKLNVINDLANLILECGYDLDEHLEEGEFPTYFHIPKKCENYSETLQEEANEINNALFNARVYSSDTYYREGLAELLQFVDEMRVLCHRYKAGTSL